MVWSLRILKGDGGMKKIIKNIRELDNLKNTIGMKLKITEYCNDLYVLTIHDKKDRKITIREGKATPEVVFIDSTLEKFNRDLFLKKIEVIQDLGFNFKMGDGKKWQ